MTADLATPMRFAYADPPYIGQAAKHYRHQPDYGGEVDHAVLVERLCTEYPDGWAVSASSSSLPRLLPLCPASVRVMAWVKTWCSFKPGVNPAYAWEPLIVCGGRRRKRDCTTVRDWLAAPATTRRGLPGAKPDAFCIWLFQVLGAQPGDELVDLFPGTGAVTRAWRGWISQPALQFDGVA
jgi:hypothetical protein